MSRLSGFAVLVLIVLGNLGFWWLINRPHSDMSYRGMIDSISFSPFRKDDNPLEDRYPTAASIDSDLALVATKTHGIRLYTALPDDVDVAAMAAKHGLSVTAGAWIRGALADPNLHLDKVPATMNGDELKAYQTQMHDLMLNEAELDAAIAKARNNGKVDRVIIGNETIYRGEASVPQMIDYIRRVKAKIHQPVGTAEPAYVWINHPELARAVDFIGLQVLPYWEGVPVDDAVDFVFGQVSGLQRLFPDKPVRLTEVGWPSAGKARQTAEPSLINQALFLRRFLNAAQDRGIDYNVIEAFDQPWKKTIEWSVGAHWGLWDADRNPKFSWTKPVIEVRQWPVQATAATLLALGPLLWLVFTWRHLRTRGKMFFALLLQFVASLAIWTLSTPVLRDFAPSAQLLYTVLAPALLILLAVVLISGYELTELTWTRQLRRGFTRANAPKPTRFPKVSIHLPCYSEPPEMLKLTLDSLAALDYPDFEVVVVDNNTKNPELWKPVLEHCSKLGPRFKFYHLGRWPGAKAGALNFALAVTDPAAEVIGVINSDYIVDKDWLSALVPHFENPKVGWVQAPQDHREWEGDLFKEFINWEYAGFFDIGMVARNEDNAIIQHGTMTLLRRAAIETVGGWGEWCIVEDAELGLRLLADGYDAVYLSERFGRGLTPDNFTAYKKQRFRWAYGAVQILKAHWRALVPFRETGLTAAQKYHFVTGWLPWFADAFYLLFTALSVVLDDRHDRRAADLRLPHVDLRATDGRRVLGQNGPPSVPLFDPGPLQRRTASRRRGCRHGTDLHDRPRHVVGPVHAHRAFPAHTQNGRQVGLDGGFRHGPRRDRADDLSDRLRHRHPRCQGLERQRRANLGPGARRAGGSLCRLLGDGADLGCSQRRPATAPLRPAGPHGDQGDTAAPDTDTTLLTPSDRRATHLRAATL